MDKVIFRCSICKLALSVPLVELVDRSMLCNKREKDYIGQGYFVVADDGFDSSAIGHYVINLDDAQNTAQHEDLNRFVGCCGPDGTHGRNTVCMNDHEVGTERSDCVTSRSLAFDPLCVEIDRVPDSKL